MTREDRKLSRLRERAFTLVNKLQSFQDKAAELYPNDRAPSVEGIKQQLMDFYSEGQSSENQ